jgi:hypothetical protein
MFHEYPKSLYLNGWADLDAHVVVSDAAEEDDARAQGYLTLAEVGKPAAPRRGRPPKARDE